MKRIYLFVMILSILTVLGACTPLPPVIDEKCMDYTEYSFYQIETETAIGTSKDQWMLETNHGPIEVSDKTYEGAMNYEYSEICYEREDTVATTYSYTKKSDSIRPEPEVIYETITETITVTETIIETIYTHNVVDGIQINSELPQIYTYQEDIAWATITVTEDARVGVSEDIPWELVNFLEGDTIIITIVFEPHTITSDKVWIAQYAHYRFGVLQSHHIFAEDFVNVDEDTLEEYTTNYVPAIILKDIYDTLYPEVSE